MQNKLFVFLGIAALATGLLAGCAGTTAPTATPASSGEQPEVEVAPIVSATGEVRPAEWTDLSFATGGTVSEILVAVGDTVEQGAILAHLDTADLDVELLQAQANLTQAEAQLAKAQTGPTEEEIEAAEESLNAAQARISAAVARRDALYEGATEAEITQGELDLFGAQQNLERANNALNTLAQFNPVNCEQYEANDRPCPIGSWAAVASQVRIAELQVQAAQAYLAELQEGPDPDQVRVQNARIWMASAQAEAAEARLELLRAQPFQEQIAVAQAEVEQAEIAIEALEARLAQTTLEAPLAGTITAVEIDPQEFVGPGQIVIQIGDLSTLRVETTDLNEIDVARVAVGDSAIVTFDALPDVTINGTVVRIAPKADAGSGVNYPVIIELDDIPPAVRWGMTAFVDIEVE